MLSGVVTDKLKGVATENLTGVVTEKLTGVPVEKLVGVVTDKLTGVADGMFASAGGTAKVELFTGGMPCPYALPNATSSNNSCRQ